MKRIFAVLILMAAFAVTMPSAGYADEPTGDVVAGDTLTAPATPAIVDPVPVDEPVVDPVMGPEVPTAAAEVPAAIADPVMMTEAETPKVEFEPFFDVSTPGNLVMVMAGSIPIIMEGVKLIPGVQAVWAGNLLRLLALILGGLGGLAAYFGAFGGNPTYTPLVALICGLAGGGGYTLIKWGSQSIRGAGKSAAGFATTKAMILMGVSGVLLICMMGMVGCGTTFTAKAGEATTTAIFRGPPGQMVAKVADKTACTVNSAPGDEMLITNPCKAGMVPWYEGVIVTCIDNPCLSGTLTHNPDGTVACK